MNATFTPETTISVNVSERPSMPPEIAKAVVAVMAQITPLSKDSKNSFQKYSYVSVDQFYEQVGRLMAGAGLFVVAFEKTMDVSKRQTTDDRGQTKESVWLSAVYDLFLYHETGSQFGPIERSITVPASGAQAYASALSFVEKYFLRSLLKIPTGEADEDAAEKRDLPANRRADSESLDSRRYFLAQAKRDWKGLSTEAGMKTWWQDNKGRMNSIFDGIDDPVYVELKEAYVARGVELHAVPSAAE